MNERVFKDTRLLEALEFIDDEYIASAARYKMKYEAQPAEPPKMTWRTPLKHWRQFVALAACILLLSIASPLVSYIAEVIRDFNAGAGSSNTSEFLTEPETTNGMYDEYILTEEDLAELNEAYMKWSKGALYADSIEEARTQNVGNVFIGKFNNYFAFVYIDNPNLNLYKDIICICYNSNIYFLDDAYEKGFVSDDELNKINEIYNKKTKTQTDK